MDVSIIIVSYNRSEVLRRTLESLYRHINSPECEVIVVDNASTEPNLRILRDEFPQVRSVVNAGNDGFGCANNRGAKLASADLLLFVNSDIVLNGNPVPEMIRTLREREDIGIVACQLKNQDGTSQPSYYRFPGIVMRFLQLSGLKNILLRLFPSIRYSGERLVEADFASGAFLMISRELFFRVGGFDERYFIYLEDADLSFQVRRLGKKTCVYNTSEVIHLGQNYESSSAPFVLYNMNRGQILFYQKNYAPWKYYGLLFMSLSVFTLKYVCLAIFAGSRESLEAVRGVISLYAGGIRKNK